MARISQSQPNDQHLMIRVPFVITLALVLLVASLSEADWQASWNLGGYVPEIATHIAVDDSGQVAVAGYAYIEGRGDTDIVVILYDSDGAIVWDHLYDGGFAGALGCDEPVGVGFDSLGNVYVAGKTRFERAGTQDYDYVAIKFSSEGVVQWTSLYDTLGGSSTHGDDRAAAMVVDASGTTYITGESDGDYLTVVFDNTGARKWAVRYQGEAPGTEGDATALTVDNSGNVYVTGRFMDENAYYDYVTVRYTAAGAESWKARYGNPGGNSYQPADIALTTDGRVVATGHGAVDASQVEWDILTVSWSVSDGSLDWADVYDGTETDSGYVDGGSAIAADHLGNVFVGGHASMAGSGEDYVTIKYGPTGSRNWVQTYSEVDDSGDCLDRINDIAIDSSGNVYVAGGLWVDHFGIGREQDYAIIKYTNHGVAQWIEYYDAEPAIGYALSDTAKAIAVTGSGDVAVTGEGFGALTRENIDTIFLESDGILFKDDFESEGVSNWSETSES